MKKMQQGFTLIELMIVVAIIAILAAIALPAYRDYTVKAKITNAVGGIAGEKIKVGENFGAAQANLCTGVADGICINDPADLLAEAVLEGSYEGYVVQLTPSSSTGRIEWACEVTTAPSNTTLTENNVPDPCTF